MPSQVKGFYTKDGKVRPITQRQPHIRTLQKGTASLGIPKKTVRYLHARRSKRARAVDEGKRATLTTSGEEWNKHPNRLDMKGVDYPEGHGKQKAKQKHAALTPTQLEVQKEILEKVKEEPDLGKEAVVDQVSGHKHSNTLVREEYERLAKQGKISKAKPKKSERKTKYTKIGKKPRIRYAMTGIERAHLKALAQKHGLDTQEIDSKIGYHANKQHLESLAKGKGATASEIHGSDVAIEQAEAGHASYLHQLANELEEAGYKVEAPEGM